MCCFSSKTEVSATRIFARKVRPDAQALVYQMNYSAAQPTAMILPLPVALPASDASVVWKSLKEFATFFTDLEAGFPDGVGEPKAAGSSAAAVAKAPLPVHEVGDYVASFVPSIADFSRLDPRFVIAKEVWDKIPEYKDYGFAVFQLKALSGVPHPIAFEFSTRLRDAIYFPTVHIHDGTVHSQDNFDHELYLQDATFDESLKGFAGPYDIPASTGYYRSRDKVQVFAHVEKSAGLLDGALLLHKKRLWGMLPNKDTIVSQLAIAALDASAPASSSGSQASTSTGCGQCDVGGADASSSLGPAGLALAGLSWIIRRRIDRTS